MHTIKTLFELLPYYQNSFDDKEMLYAKLNGNWEGIKSSIIDEQSTQMAVALRKLGIGNAAESTEERHKVSILSANRPEWVITDFAVQKLGGILVPIYPSISPSELTYILNEAETKVLFVQGKKIYERVKEIMPDVPNLKFVYSYDEVDGVMNWKELLQPISPEDEKEIHEVKNAVDEESVATFIYTSGTTGNPKGVMLTHKNIISNLMNCNHCFSMCDSDSNVLSFLPLNHIFERMVTYLYMYKGVSIYYAEGMETIGENLREVQPAVFTTVPRLLEKVYEKIEKKGLELEGFKRKIFDWAMKLALDYDMDKKQSLMKRMKYYVADKLVFAKWREAIGGKAKAIVTGSAACQVKLLRVFTAAKIIVMEGYGLTETSPVISVNTYEKGGRKFGTVGVVIKNVDVKIAPDGEILFKGDNVMKGYYRNQEATDQVIKDGWLHTGDIGEYENGFLKITDRKKELFKISGGKYIAPLPLENKIKESPFIEQIMVVGSNEKFVGALIVPAIQNLKEYFKNAGIQLADNIDFSLDQDCLKLIREELNKYNKTFAVHEHVKRFQLIPNEWTVDGGELTPTLKLKRRMIMKKYGHLLGKIYNRETVKP